MPRPATAVDLFTRGHSCSQSVLEAWAPALGLSAALAARLAAGFGGGVRMGSACGAATGAVLSLALAGPESVEREGRAAVAAAVELFGVRFRERTGALDCPDIVGCDLRTAEGRAFSAEHGRSRSRCEPAVRAAAEILEELLADRYPDGADAPRG